MGHLILSHTGEYSQLPYRQEAHYIHYLQSIHVIGILMVIICCTSAAKDELVNIVDMHCI
jgi:hypothetical protein